MSHTLAQCDEHEMPPLLEAVYARYGFDFRDYARASITRRVARFMRVEQFASVAECQQRITADVHCMERFLDAVTVNVTTMFRDARFYRVLRRHVTPMLRELPFVRIWHAGCSTGEEVYSLALLLEEENLLARCRIYATDVNDVALQRAKNGIFPLSSMREFTSNYLRAGGAHPFSKYYRADRDHAILRNRLKRNLVFSHHDLARDPPFNTFHLVLCRNVMIYFNRQLTARVQRLLYHSLATGGVLGLGPGETLELSDHENCYATIDREARLFLKKC